LLYNEEQEDKKKPRGDSVCDPLDEYVEINQVAHTKGAKSLAQGVGMGKV
jgi:hypothetical protein